MIESTGLLATHHRASKFHIPPAPMHAVQRDHLIDTLEQGIPAARVALVSAPAGYGKTTLLAQWARSSSYPVAWVSLDEDDDDFDRFFRLFLLAWDVVQPGVLDSAPGVRLGATDPDQDAVLAELGDLAYHLPGHLAIVVDDAHLIRDADISQALTKLAEHAPSTLHLVLSCRGAPPIPLARMRAHRDLLEIGPDELRFRTDEASDFLNGVMSLDLAADEVAALRDPLEGWVAGLQLAALTLQRHRQDPGGLVVSGRHRHISDYFREDVLSRLPEDIREFLLRTSILDQLCGPLCNAVTGLADGQDMLEYLERSSLFVVPLDDRREWFRYHRLFADHLRDELQRREPDAVPDLHRRAGWWNLEHDLPEPAFRHALAADDVQLGGEVFNRSINEKLNTGELQVIRGWLDALPASWLDALPVFGLAEVGLLIARGEPMVGISRLEEVAQHVARADLDNGERQLAMVTAVRCFVACGQNNLAQAVAYAEQALRDLAPEDHSFRATIYHALGDTYRRNGHWDEARARYLKVLETTREPLRGIQAGHVFGALADLELMRGHLRVATDYWTRALSVFESREQWGRAPLPVIGWVQVRLGESHYEHNDLAAAREQLQRGLERAALGGDAQSLIAGNVILARLELTEGDPAAASASLGRVRPMVEQGAFPEWSGRFERMQVELWLDQRLVRKATDWAMTMADSDTLATSPERDVTQLAIGRALIASGDARLLEQAQALLGDVLLAAERDGRTGIQIEALALRALTSGRQGDRTGALTFLEGALRLAEPEGYVRLFADLGPAMASLLQDARGRNVMPAYLDTLLAAFGVAAPHRPPGARALPEPLTHREREVVRLIAAGLTNNEIANTLYISPETVKKHTGSIFGKLGVGNRTEAAARARDLGLLDQAGS